MTRRLSGLSGFIEQEQLLSNVIESENASKRYSFPSALIISEVCDIRNNCFLFLQDCTPLHQSRLRFRSTFAIVTTRQNFSCMGIHENCFAFASYCTLLHLQKLDTAS